MPCEELWPQGDEAQQSHGEASGSWGGHAEAPARSTWVFLLHNETHEARQVLAKHGIRQDIDYYLTVVGQQADPSSPAKSYKLHI